MSAILCLIIPAQPSSPSLRLELVTWGFHLQLFLQERSWQKLSLRGISKNKPVAAQPVPHALLSCDVALSACQFVPISRLTGT